ncbi:MAG: NAD(P)H-hydrate dehydratase [Candidatus Zixiibacteriota bacterium]|nr:MAG: NAD(P)H-hydrate dehydratase [candidate division Zixibacteria bacterium]
MKLVTSESMRLIDREAIDKLGIPGPELMENAGRGIAEKIMADILQTSDDHKIAIFCGKGNNGGDGYVIGRHLHEAGVKVAVYLMGPAGKLSPDAKLNYDRAKEIGLDLHELKKAGDLPQYLDANYIVDAVFGTGFEGAPHGVAEDIIGYMNSQPQPVIAVDMPSGLNADNGQAEGAVVVADYTYTLALPKYGLYVSPGRELAGFVQVVPIGLPDEAIDKFNLTDTLITHDYVESALPFRKPDGHKGDFGTVFILAGSTGLTGAAALAAKSALRGGCGLAKVGCPRSVLPIIASSVIEATTMPLPDVAKKGALALRGLGEVRLAVKEHDAVIIGPGIGRHHETFELVQRLVTSIEKPVIIDADGVNALVGHLDLLSEARAPVVVTPHPGEFKRLTGISAPEDIHARLKIARDFASEHKVVLVLKGSPTVIADEDGGGYLNQTGNNGMATGGSGDVLSGLIGSFMAQGMEPLDAALCGVYIHGFAGDIAACELTDRALIAGDIVDFLPEVFDTFE